MATTVLTGTIIRSGSIPATALGGGVISASAQLATSLPTGTVSSSAQIDYNSITNKLSGVVSSSAQVTPLLPGSTVSSSGQVDITATSNYSTFSSSLATVDATQQVSLTALNAATSSYAINSTLQGQLAGVVSSSTQVPPLLPGGTVSASGQVDITTTTGYSTFSSSLATVDATQQVSLTALNAATSSYAINSTLQSQLAGVVSSSTQVKPLLPGGTVSSSAQVSTPSAYTQSIFNSSGTWTKPATGNLIQFEIWGGGGGGCGAGYNTTEGGGGGGGGAGVHTIVPFAIVSASVVVTIGQGGAGGPPATDGSTGGASSVGPYLIGSSSISFTAFGGEGGRGPRTVGPAGGAVGFTGSLFSYSAFPADSSGGTGGHAGTNSAVSAIKGSGSLRGGGGGGGGASVSFWNVFGRGGSSLFGGEGGSGGWRDSLSGSNGLGTGAGGGGGGNDDDDGRKGPGGSGANGKIIITVW